MSLLIIYGQRPVEELLAHAPENVRKLYVAESSRDLPNTDVAIERVDIARLDQLCEGGNHQGIAADIGEFQYSSVDQILEAIGDRSRACVLVLDQVQDPQNLGAILRSAVALGADGVVIAKDRSAQITPAVIRASAGLALRCKVARVTNIARTISKLKDDHRFWAVGALLDNAQSPSAVDFDMRTALVLGAEGSGIRRLVEEACDFRVRIPMADDVDSLNVSVTAGILLYEALHS